ncbi:ABC transporter ATP-binding protein [Cereibacter sphaeroides]|nr:ABC transporter ATP-binding protein [Cereibacter sphaeroides]
MYKIRNLSLSFDGHEAVRSASFDIPRGARLGLVGESGCGKSITALALLGMAPASARVSGSIEIDGQEMAAAPERLWRPYRARKVAMVFQEPLSALNPLKRVGDIIAEPMRLHLRLDRRAARARARDLLVEVGIPDPEARLDQYPHQLSGGQRQRVLIAAALSCDPQLLVADEPTTALDAHVAGRILDLLKRLSETRDMALVFISHDLEAVARVTEEMLVMYGGDIVERGPTAQLLADPRHPYTKGLIEARPRLDALTLRADGAPRPRLASIPGSVPALADLPKGCRFAGRCPIERPACAGLRPAVSVLGPGQRQVRCLAPLLPAKVPA